MPYQVLRYETTPNPNAIKCVLDRVISTEPRSFKTAKEAESNPVARRLFEAGATSVLVNDDWITVNRPPALAWKGLKSALSAALTALENGAPGLKSRE